MILGILNPFDRYFQNLIIGLLKSGIQCSLRFFELLFYR